MSSAATIGITTEPVSDVESAGTVLGAGVGLAVGGAVVGMAVGVVDGSDDGMGVGLARGVGLGVGRVVTVKVYEPRASSPSSDENDVQRTS